MANQLLKLIIQLKDPPSNYAFCLQRGKGSKAERLDYIEVLEGAVGPVEFELEVTVRTSKNLPEPDFFGPYAQGTIGVRFFYLCIGKVEDRGDPRWSGRIKVPLVGIDWSMIEQAAKPNHFLFARYQASRPDGQPVYASVQLLDRGWAIESGD